MTLRPGATPLLAALLLAGVPVAKVAAVDSVQLRVGNLSGPDWEMGDLSLTLTWSNPASTGIHMSAGEVRLPPPLDRVQSLELDCPRAALKGARMDCPEGSLRLVSPLLDAPDMRVDFRFDRLTGDLQARIHGLAFAGSKAELNIAVTQGAWKALLEEQGVDLPSTARHLGTLVPALPGLGLKGRLDLKARAQGDPAPTKAHLTLHTHGLAFSGESGQYAGEALAGNMELDFQQRNGLWHFSAGSRLDSGQTYMEPIYLEIHQDPIEVAAEGVWDPVAQRVDIDRAHFKHPGVLALEGHGRFDLNRPLEPLELSMQVTTPDLAGTYPVYLQPFLYGTVLDNLEVTGEVNGTLIWGAPVDRTAVLDLKGVYLDDRQGRFGIYGLNGNLRWLESGQASTSRLAWEGGHVYRLDLGEAQAQLGIQGRSLVLLQPLEVTLLDGGLRLDTLSLERLGEPDMSWTLEALLTPISMTNLSQQMGWPLMNGSLSGVIPRVRYADHVAHVEGALLVRAFDGEMVVRDLTLEHPFGLVPRLSADIDINNLDLDTLSHTFSFGNIQGRLDGYVHNLVLENWQPVSFDARFQTPKDDDSRHRISQRAVDNLASLGGASGVLSRTFMRFFEEFSYNRLGLGCRMRRGVCRMDGIAPAKNGYYIVKGGGIPRIDVVGFNQEVDWNTLLERLKNVTTSQGPVIK